MKQLLQLLFMGLFPVILFSQTPEEKITITKDYDNVILTGLANSFKAEAEFEKTKALELARQNGWDIRKEENGVTYELMKISEEGNPIYYVTYNVNAALSTRANTLHNGGLLGLNVEGQNMTAHVWDAGLARSTHQEYDGAGGSNRFSIGDGTSALHYHSAHVTGTLIASGYVASAKGMAPQAYAVGYEWNNDISEATTAAGSGMLLSNHSYGWGASSLPDWYFGAYIDESRDWDAVMYNAPYYLMVVAAGNDGNDNTSNGNPLDGNSSYDKLSGHTTCKNNMVVANAQDASIDASGNLISVSINTGSSEGPTDDYRIKPDITGNGTTLYSTYENADNAYASISGTSMASPNVCGTLLLLQKHYHNLNAGYMRAATLKGLALHTADDAGPSGPDAVYGWGLLNAKAAANTITNNGNTSLISQLTLNQGGTYTLNVASDGINNLIASISWTDPAGTANTGIANDPTPALVNDLDIRVTQGGTTYYPHRLTSITTNGTGDNDVDPFEKIILAGATGNYTITVSHKGTLSGGSQNFSLIVTGRATPSTPPTANFIASNTLPSSSSVTVNFTDQSSNAPTSWLWSFNPSTVTYVSGSNTSQNPSVRFNNPGAYTVSLTATNAYGSDSEIKTTYIHMGQPGLWTGATSTDWNTFVNWENHLVPGSTDNVFIYPSAINWPLKTGNFTVGTDCNTLNLTTGTQLTVTGNIIISAGKTLNTIGTTTIKVGGNWTNNGGTFIPASGKVEFNGTLPATITSPPASGTFSNDGFETDLGWQLSGEFQRGIPQGLGGEYGNNDPSTAYAGSYILGVDLTGLGLAPGDYENGLTDRAYQAISPTINCSGFTNVQLNFQRWLGLEQSTYDHGYIEISNNNGSSWAQIWTNTSTLQESSWSSQTINISAYADNQSQVKIRFCIGATDGSWRYCGWNIDDFSLTGSGSGAENFNNLEISKSNNTVTTNGNITVNANFTIKPNAYFTNSTGNTLTVNGASLFMADNTGMASFINNGTFNGTGTTNVQQYLTSERWHSISPPISNATINVYYDVYLLQYDESDNTWDYMVEPTTMPLNPIQGYYAWVDDSWPIPSNPVTFQGTLNNVTDYPVTLSYTTGAPMAGYNLVGNPFPCAMDWNTNSGWNRTNMSGWMTIKEGATYCGWNPYLNQGWNGKTNGIIPSTQGFWVRRLDGSPTTFTIPASERVHNSLLFYKSTIENPFPSIRLKVENSGISDETVVIFHPEGNSGFDGLFDLEKFTNGTSSPDLYTVVEGKDYAFNIMTEDYSDAVIPVYFKAGMSGICRIEATEVINFTGGVNIYLQDLKTGTVTLLEENTTYEYDYSPLDELHRFNLHFNDAYFGLEEGITTNGILVYTFEDMIHINLPERITADVTVYDLTGREMLRQKISNEKLTQIRFDAETGYYLVKVQTGEQYVTQKVFIK
jgi:PKD repeat protein